MAYTTYEQIEQDFKDQTFAESSGNVRRADVTQFIVEADALINSYVGMRYTTPVASGEGLELLRLLSRSLVAQRVKRILEVVQQVTNDGVQQNVLSTLLSPTEVMKILRDIRNGDLNLAGATLLTSSRGGFFSNNVSNDVEPKIKKDERQW